MESHKQTGRQSQVIKLETINYYDSTIGRMWCGDFQCFTLELPWLDNQRNVSCIPAGKYEYFKRKSPKNGHVIELKDVDGRIIIQIHAGNYTREIKGCILVGDSIRFLDCDAIPDVTNSRNTMALLLAAAPDTGFIEVIRHA